MEQLMQHPLTGNVRELENLLHRALALGEGGDLSFENLSSMATEPPVALASALAPPPARAPEPARDVTGTDDIPDNLQAWLDDREREVLQKTLAMTRYNRTAAAQRLGLNLRQMRYRMARLNITVPGSGGADADDLA